MEFKSRNEVQSFLKKNTVYLGEGGQGKSYYNRDSVYKIYYNFLDPIEEDTPWEEEEVLRFKDTKTSLIIFPYDVIKLKSEVIGEITKYVKGTDLDKLNPLDIDLDCLIKLVKLAIKEMELISKEHIKTYDVMYNTLLGEQFYIVDTLEYMRSDWDYKKLNDFNMQGFNNGIIYFLIDGLFTEALSHNSAIMEMYKSGGFQVSLLDFINEVRRELSKLVGHKIKTLREAKQYMNQNQAGEYKRLIRIK